MPGVIREAGRDRQAVRDDGERRLQRKVPGEPGNPYTRVEDHRALVRQLGDGGLCDAVLLVGRGGLALGEVGLEVGARPAGISAVRPPADPAQ